ncbi:MAG: glycosyltransferase family 39 protein [Proteobacteria bacterium]|nr:glycosyltransferase family 39 protein [Pseudomonadota bacterium]
MSLQNSDGMKNLTFWCGIFFLSLLSAYQVFQTTTWGAGLSSDSIHYLSGARNLIEDGNLRRIGSHWPPLYYIIIAFSNLIISDTLLALRWLQIATMVANLLCFSCILWKVSKKALIPTLVGSLLFATAPSVLYNHTMAWSEGTFLFFAMLGIYFLGRYLEYENRLTLLFFSSMFISLAFITRYAGITLIITCLIALLWFSVGDRKKRINTCLFFGLISSLPMLVWISRNWLISNETTGRSFAFHPIPTERIRQGVSVLENWLHIPSGYPILLLVVLGLIIAMYVITINKNTIIHQNRTLEICFIFVVIYISFILISISSFDAGTPLDNRILLPVYAFFYLGVLLLIQRSSCIKWAQKFGYILLITLILHAFSQHQMQKRFITHAQKKGVDFAAKEWVVSETLQWLKTLPTEAIIYTNGPDPIKIYANRTSKMLPRHTYTGTNQRNENIVNEINSMAKEMLENDGVIVYFHTITWRWYLPTFSQLNQILPLKTIYKGKDATVVRLSETHQ